MIRSYYLGNWQGNNMGASAIKCSQRINSAFVSVWDTTKVSTGSSFSNQIMLPLYEEGEYDFTVNWGDGTTERITAYNQREVTHEYATSGIYGITVKGKIRGFRFNNTGDRLKLLQINRWGNLWLGNLGWSFYGCENLRLNNTLDTPDFTGMDSLRAMFSNCYALEIVNRMDEWLSLIHI